MTDIDGVAALIRDWLTHNHHLPLRRSPAVWDGCAFWQVETGLGLHLVLAPDEDCAERAAVRYFGEANRPRVIEGPFPIPILAFGWGQYLDAVQLLEGDPARPALRSPDSSPALDAAMSFIDALGDPTAQSPRDASSFREQGRRIDAWERMHRARLRHLESVGAIGERSADPTWDGERWRA